MKHYETITAVSRYQRELVLITPRQRTPHKDKRQLVLTNVHNRIVPTGMEYGQMQRVGTGTAIIVLIIIIIVSRLRIDHIVPNVKITSSVYLYNICRGIHRQVQHGRAVAAVGAGRSPLPDDDLAGSARLARINDEPVGAVGHIEADFVADVKDDRIVDGQVQRIHARTAISVGIAVSIDS